MRFDFTIAKYSGKARAGYLSFKDNTSIPTPIFMPVGTQGTVKAIEQNTLEDIGYQLILGNTYHLYLRPGMDMLHQSKGLGNFMSWPNHILTDSGGYQAFSLSSLTQYKDEGIIIRSHLDGSSHWFSPEKIIDIQQVIAGDIIMPLDDCPPYPSSIERLRLSLKRTHDWFQKSYNHFHQKEFGLEQTLFALVQGGLNISMRKQSCEYLSQFDPSGFALGGFSVGEKNSNMIDVLSEVLHHLDTVKPCYLMGVGSIPEIFYAVECGVDMFDCVLPTRNARNGQLLTSLGKINIKNQQYTFQEDAIDPSCSCLVCQRYSRAYLRHLYKAGEILYTMLATQHNLHFMHHLMFSMHMSIIDNTWADLKKKYMDVYCI